MNIFSRVRLALNESSWDSYMRGWLSGKDLDTNAVDVGADTAMNFSAVFSCFRVLAETFATIPIAEYRKIDDHTREKTDSTGWYDILHNVYNDEMSAYNGAEMMVYQQCLGGNFVAKRVISSRMREPMGLIPYQWQNVAIDRDKTTGKLVYEVPGSLPSTEKIKLSRAEVFHVPGPSLNGITGMSLIEYAAQAIRLGLTYEKFGINFYKNGVLSSGVVEHPKFLNDEAYNRLEKKISDQWGGLSKAGKPMLFEDGLTFKQIQMKLVDAELLSSKRFQIEDFCRFCRIPPHLVQHLEKATNNNIEHMSLEFAMYTMLPYAKRYESAVNTQLLTRQQRKDGYYFECNMAALMRGDQKSMAEAFAVGRQWGWLSVNDIRKLLNLNPVPNGDIYLQPMNMIEAGKEVVEDQYKEIVDAMYKLIESKGATSA